MIVLINEMPKKKEECLFYRKETYQGRLMNEWCGINGMKCSFKNENSIFSGECRCLDVSR